MDYTDSGEMVIKIADFGLCQPLDTSVVPLIGGTYGPPERVIDRIGHIDYEKADVFSSGIMLFHLLFRRLFAIGEHSNSEPYR